MSGFLRGGSVSRSCHDLPNRRQDGEAEVLTRPTRSDTADDVGSPLQGLSCIGGCLGTVRLIGIASGSEAGSLPVSLLLEACGKLVIGYKKSRSRLRRTSEPLEYYSRVAMYPQVGQSCSVIMISGRRCKPSTATRQNVAVQGLGLDRLGPSAKTRHDLDCQRVNETSVLDGRGWLECSYHLGHITAGRESRLWPRLRKRRAMKQVGSEGSAATMQHRETRQNVLQIVELSYHPMH